MYFENMRTTRANFKLVLRKCRADNDRIMSDKLATNLLHRDSKAFWNNVKNVSSCSIRTQATTIEGTTGKENICSMWRRYFQDLLNSSKDTSKKDEVLKELSIQDNCLHGIFTPGDVMKSVSKLKLGKSAGLDSLSSEHFKYASHSIHVHLSIIFNSMLLHGTVPDTLMDSLIVTLLKDKKGDVTDKDNYRPIAITCVSSKVLELLLLEKFSCYLDTGNHQFGFKSGHSTDQCVFVLKEVINYFASKSSPVYTCFVDASKAFDRVNHWGLLSKLLKRHVPKIVVRLFMVWFTTQKFYVKWDNVISSPFTVSNGVRQGGILSPLFLMYLLRI